MACRSGAAFPVEQKLMRQWMMRITAYAQRLLTGLDTIDWTESLKEQQRNWIGQSVGAIVKFPSGERASRPHVHRSFYHPRRYHLWGYVYGAGARA